MGQVLHGKRHHDRGGLRAAEKFQGMASVMLLVQS